MSHREQQQQIFIDYNMNVRGKTLAAAYFPRGSPGAPNEGRGREQLCESAPTELPEQVERSELSELLELPELTEMTGLREVMPR